MHCADLDYQIFSILPPFNVVHAQVVQTGTASTKPRLLSGADAEVYYSATSSSVDPCGRRLDQHDEQPVAVRRQEQLLAGSAAAERHTAGTLGGLAYRSLYPGAVLDLFAPIPAETGLPVPDPAALPSLAPAQQRMPSPGNVPQKFARYDTDVPFFASFPFGAKVLGANWFSADGIPILPVDDAGRTNPYPLMRVQAVAKGADATKPANVKASLDIVLPVASEADCRNCHNGVDGRAAVFASVTKYANGTPWVVATGSHGAGARQGQQCVEDQHPAAARRQVGREVHVERHRRGDALQRRHGELLPRPAARDPVLAMPLLAGARPGAGRSDRRARGRRQRPPADAAHLDVARDALQPRPVRQAVPGHAAAEERRPHAGRADGHPRPDVLPVPSGQADEVPARRHGRGRRRVPGLPRRHEAGRQRLHRGLPGGRGRRPRQARAVGGGAEVPVLPRRRCEERDDDEPRRSHRRARRHSQPAGVHEEQRGDGGGEDHRRARLALRREPEALSAFEGTRRRVLPGLPRRDACRVAESESRGQRQHRGLAAAGPQRDADRVHHLPRGRIARVDAEWPARNASGQRRELDGQAQAKSPRTIATAAGPATA